MISDYRIIKDNISVILGDGTRMIDDVPRKYYGYLLVDYRL